MLVDLPLPRLEAQSSNQQLEQEGACVPLLLSGIQLLIEEPGK